MSNETKKPTGWNADEVLQEMRDWGHAEDWPSDVSTLTRWVDVFAALIADRDALREDEKRLDWMQSDMTNGDDGVGIYWSDGGFVFPYLVSNAGGSGGGVGVAFFETLREAIDSARANETT